MSTDHTQQQSSADLQRSKELSLERTRAPAEVEGYQTQKFLGSGAYGEVWVGVDRNTGRKVAIKFYAHRRGVDWSLLSREVEKLVFLSADRYVVQLLDVGWDADPPYYVMEYVEQGSLDDLLKRHGTFTVPEAVELFHEIAVGLAHAHGKGVLHCDLKPANILLDQDQKPRLADFGQSRLSHEQKPALGTLFYMAPEQADLEAVPDVRWDVYALGAILYTLLVGSPPYRNDDTVGKIDSAADLSERLARYRHAIRAAPPPSEHRKVPGIDRALVEIVDRCLAANPDDRFANVQEVLDALAARQRNRERLPLMVLGFIGPLLVLLVTALFSYRGYAKAVEDAEQGYAQWAMQNNQFAAELAAEKVTGEIARYFEIARAETELPAFRPLFFAVADESPNLARLVDPDTASADAAAAREDFLAEASRLQLDRHLQERLARYKRDAGRDPRTPRFASVFVTDRYGTQLAAAFDDESRGASIGTNRAHRTYFHGGGEDLPPFDRVPPNPTHVTQPHLSAVFKSATQGIWKVAVSAPIYRAAEGEPVFEGLLVFTVALSDFEVSRSGMPTSNDPPPGAPREQQFLVLVDGREGEEQGTILHHPVFSELADAELGIPSAMFDRGTYRVGKHLFHSRKDADYEDPVGQFVVSQPPRRLAAERLAEERLAQLAARYRRRWVAAAAPVLLPSAGADNGKASSGLVMLVQSDYQAVVQPARRLGEQFIRNSFWMLVVMAAVSLALWYIVVRLFREPRAGLNRAATPLPESTPLHGMTTIPVQRKRR